jgi:hypothetical protein
LNVTFPTPLGFVEPVTVAVNVIEVPNRLGLSLEATVVVVATVPDVTVRVIVVEGVLLATPWQAPPPAGRLSTPLTWKV